jgi:asparagine synthase (glutamine-hydrolysing)
VIGMANFLFVRDPDRVRRQQTLEAAGRIALTFDHLVSGILESQEAGLVWAVAPSAPVLHTTDTSGGIAFLLGDALANSGPERLTASEYWGRWANDSSPPEGCDGLYVGVRFDDLGHVTVAGDLLGILPIYYTQAGGALLIASSPALLNAHPAYRPALDPAGLAGILLTNGLINGATMYRGVRRLSAGHALRARPGSGMTEVRQYEVPIGTAHHGAPVRHCASLLKDALVAACSRHVPNHVPHTLLLSGGLDSRLLAGILARQGASLTAVTMGIPSDIEFQCARGVTRALGLPHHLLSLPSAPEKFAAGIRRDGLSHSPGAGSTGLVEALAALGPRVVSGYAMDAIVGGSHIEWCYAPGKDRIGFEVFFRKLNEYGIPLESLRRLLRPDIFGESLDQVIHGVQQSYESGGNSDLERAWRFDLHHRQRFHSGPMLVRHTFGSWPISPSFDREVLAVAGNVPLAVLAGRWLEREVLIREFPHLAQLPLDRNSYDTLPLRPRLRHLARRAAAEHLTAIRSRLGIQGRERRYYYRGFDINGPNWRAVRQAMEPFRELAYSLFDRRAFDELLPGPDQTWNAGDVIAGASGMKMLLGMLAWLSPPPEGGSQVG